jgi:uncharacterized protein (DUF305 family)
MIAHHGQALTMARMIPSRTTRQDFHLLGERIITSQQDEISFMTRWLKQQKADSAMHHHEHTMMPGMLSDDELAHLGSLKGAEFEQAFLKGMIRHHEGALQMVKTLLSTQGGAQDLYVARFAADVDADQTAEIGRMKSLLQPTP